MPRLLIIDDEANLCRTLSLFFRSKGMETFTAFSMLEGLRLFREVHPSFVICDVRLPDGSGLDVLARIREIDPKAYVIMITAYQDMDTTITAMQQGAFDYIHKDFEPDELEIVVRKAQENQRLNRAVTRLTAERSDPRPGPVLVGRSRTMLEIYKTIGAVSSSNATVLITGESGTGKELIARAIHESGSPHEPFISINCSAITETLMESEMFGHERGSFTGADRQKIGKFELAGKGTIFLDEIGDLAQTMHAKLLRVLQEKEFTRVGGNQLLDAEARVVPSTIQSLENLVRQGLFREDLYYRLKVITIHVPPLRDRQEDIPLLVEHFIEEINREVHKDIDKIPGEIMDRLVNYEWRGNVRELQNFLTRAVVLSKGGVLELPPSGLEDSGLSPPRRGAELRSLDEMEAEHIGRVLGAVGWHQGKACNILGVSRPTLRKKIKDYKLKETLQAATNLSSRVGSASASIQKSRL